MSDDEQWYFDTATHQAVQGKQKGFQNRMGPYPTREAAERALETARARNEAADAADRD
ncbi:hypothetical protein GCM10027047_11350 [Rhodococcus aerolatus]